MLVLTEFASTVLFLLAPLDDTVTYTSADPRFPSLLRNSIILALCLGFLLFIASSKIDSWTIDRGSNIPHLLSALGPFCFPLLCSFFNLVVAGVVTLSILTN